jgi:hypothetical protein
MNTNIYMKKKSDPFWGKHPYIMTAIIDFTFAICLLAGAILIHNYSVVVLFFVGLIPITLLQLYSNKRHHLTEYTAFIRRDDVLYVIQLIYDSVDKNDISGAVGDFLYTPSGSELEIAALPHNIAVAKNVQSLEKAVRNIGRCEQTYINALTYILDSFDKYPDKTFPDSARGKIDRFIMCNLENNKLYPKMTDHGQFLFMTMKNPQIIKETKRILRIKYTEVTGEEGIATYSNVFDGLADCIKDMSNNK